MSSSIRKQIPELIKREIMYNQKYQCNICRIMLPISYQIDHQVPHSISNNDSIQNLQALCINCHSIKTLRENERIIRFKKYCCQKGIEKNKICWFCLENCNNSCNRTLKRIELKPKNVKTVEEFEKMCDNFEFLKVDNRHVLKVEICFYNLCIFVNNYIYKSNVEDIAIQDIANAIDLATRSKKYSKRYTTLHIRSLFNYKPDSDDLERYYEFLGENILDNLNERVFKDINNVRLILD